MRTLDTCNGKRNTESESTGSDYLQVRTSLGVDLDRKFDARLDRRDRAMRLSRFYGQVESGLGRANTPRRGDLSCHS
jgi:hypothetical protein